MGAAFENVSFQFSGRYAVLGTLGSNTKHILFVLHGQGQLTKYFIQKFKPLLALGYVIIAPEGLNHYYLDGFSGRVGASWMTSENRLAAIDNYINFLNASIQQVQKSIPTDTPIHILGFSQGTATASRWIANSNFNFDSLTLWGGALPPDLNKAAIIDRFRDKKITHVIGNKDEFINKGQVEEIKQLTKNYSLKSDYLLFDGGHDIEQHTLLRLFSHV